RGGCVIVCTVSMCVWWAWWRRPGGPSGGGTGGATPTRRNLNVDGASCRGCSRSLPALELLVRRDDLALVLHADPVRVVGRRGLITRGRCGHGVPRRLAGERLLFRLRRSKR